MEHTLVRTTIRIPTQVHKQLSRQAYIQKRSLNEVMLEKLQADINGLSRLERFMEGEKKLAKIRREYHAQKHQYNQTEIIRKMRDKQAGRV